MRKGYHDLLKVEDMVANELIKRPNTRNSDELLTVWVYRDYFGLKDSDSFTYVLLNRKLLKVPSMETIGRCRRRLQEKWPQQYGPTQEVADLRKEAEYEFYEYAKEV